MARMKEFAESHPAHPRADGLTEVQLANVRATYEDPVAYAQWRERMGLSKAFKPRTDPIMQHRSAALLRGLVSDLEAHPRSATKHQPEPPRKLTLEELAAEYRSRPVTLSAQVMGKYTRPDPSPDYEDIEF